MLGKITFNEQSRYRLGNEPVSFERFKEIGEQIERGKLIGMPVWAYVRSGVTIKSATKNPFTCPFDSGRSGWVYCTKAVADSFGGEEKALRQLVLDVQWFDEHVLNNHEDEGCFSDDD